MRRTWHLAALPAAVLALASCAEEVKDVNRVQPDYYPKALLDGEWYYRQTIVDVPPDVGIAFVGLEGKVEKVQFDFVGEHILAYRTHEGIEGLNENGTREGAQFEGEVVFKVDGVEQFDIVRAFNSANGQQSNVLEENGSLHPEWERKYFRANWASATGFGAVDFAGLFKGKPSIGFDGLSLNTFFVPETDYLNPDHLQVDLENGTISFTQDFTTTDGGYTCFLQYGFYRSTTNTRNDCGTGIVKIRHSFQRIDPKDAAQFEPRSYLDEEPIRDADGKLMRSLTVSVPKPDGGTDYVEMECTPEVLKKLAPRYSEADCHQVQLDQMGRFGFFRTERYSANRRVPNQHDAQRHFYANHHSIWQQTYEWEMTKNDDGESVIATDEAGKPKLKLDAHDKPVAIPVKSRKVRPIVYYLNVNFPEDLKTAAQELADDWDKGFALAIASAKGVSVDALRAEMVKDGVGDKTFTIRDNDCEIAHVKAYLAENPELQDVADEATGGGELLPGNLERVCSGLTYASRKRGLTPFTYQQVGDVRFNFAYWVNEDQPEGPLGFGPSGPDPETGRIISGNAYIYGAAVDGYARDSMDLVRFLNGDISDADHFEEITSGATFRKWMENRHKSVADEALTVSDEVRADLKRRFSAFAMNDPKSVQAANGHIDLNKMAADMARTAERRDESDPIVAQSGAPDAMALMKARLKSNPELRSRMLPRPMMALLAHMFQWDAKEHPGEEPPAEMQDAMIELAANPAAIAEHLQKRAAFYMERNITMPDFIDDAVIGRALDLKGRDPEEVYAELRREIFKGVMLHEIGHTLGMTHNFRGSFDALNYFDDYWTIQDQFDSAEARDEAMQPEYRYSSIMDYGARFNSDFHGLGKYDYAAIKFAYTGLLEAFEDDVKVPGRLDLELEYGDPAHIPELLGGASDLITHRKDIPAAEFVDARREGIRHNAALYLAQPDRKADDYYADRTVPYFYCIDWFNGRDPKCRTWDEGPTNEESVRSAIQRYWNLYFFNNWRRGRDEYQFYTGFFGKIGRLLPYLSYPYKYYAYFQRYQNADGSSLPLTEDLLRASILTTNFMLEVLGTPEPGWYCKANTGNNIQEQITYVPFWAFGGNLDYFRSEGCDRYELPLGTGRIQYIDLSDDYQTKWDYMGTYFEKQNFMIPLINAGVVYVRPPESAAGELDLRFGYYDLFKDRILDLTLDMLYAGLGQFGHRLFQWRVDELDVNGEKTKRLVKPDFFNFSGLTADPNDQPAADSSAQDVEIWTNFPFDLMRYWLYAGAQLNSRPADRKLDFYEYLAVQEVGSGDDRTLAEDAQVAEFENPKTGQIFRAPQTADGLSIAYRTLRTAKSAALDWEAAKRALDADPNNADLVSGLENADQTLEFYLSIIDDMRILRAALDLGK